MWHNERDLLRKPLVEVFAQPSSGKQVWGANSNMPRVHVNASVLVFLAKYGQMISYVCS
jgi:hypothetical protein